VLGVDPGLRITGYGAVRYAGQALDLVGYGHVRTESGQPLEQRLVRLRDALLDAMRRFAVHEVALETPFVGQNVRSALALGEARGAALIAAAELGLPVYNYAPADVKRSVAGYGRGDKESVARSVALQLALTAVPTPADAADALAIALCHLAHRRARLLAGGAR